MSLAISSAIKTTSAKRCISYCKANTRVMPGDVGIYIDAQLQEIEIKERKDRISDYLQRVISNVGVEYNKEMVQHRLHFP